MPQTVHRQCTLCEAHCGIDVEVDGDRVLEVSRPVGRRRDHRRRRIQRGAGQGRGGLSG
jgi:anaerobic selenocysteine-containing dehydrogenase